MKSMAIKTVLTLALFPLLLGHMPASAQTKLLFNMFIPRNHHSFTEIMQPWAKQVADATQNRINIEFSAASLAPIPRQFDMVRSGVADLSLDQTVFNANKFELVKVIEFPFISDSTEAVNVALWRTYQKYFAKADEYEGVKVLSFMSAGASQLWTTNKVVTKLDDFKGMKIRMSGVYVRDIAQALGIAPVVEPGPKALELVSNGVVDGSAFSMIDILSFKLTSQLKYVASVPGGFYSAGFAFILNQKKWDALAKVDQDALMSVSGESFARLSGRAWDKANKTAATELAKAGIQETKLDAASVAELKKRLSAIEESWLATAARKNVDGKAALAYYREQVAAVEKEAR